MRRRGWVIAVIAGILSLAIPAIGAAEESPGVDARAGRCWLRPIPGGAEAYCSRPDFPGERFRVELLCGVRNSTYLVDGPKRFVGGGRTSAAQCNPGSRVLDAEVQDGLD